MTSLTTIAVGSSSELDTLTWSEEWDLDVCETEGEGATDEWNLILECDGVDVCAEKCATRSNKVAGI